MRCRAVDVRLAATTTPHDAYPFTGDKEGFLLRLGQRCFSEKKTFQAQKSKQAVNIRLTPARPNAHTQSTRAPCVHMFFKFSLLSFLVSYFQTVT